MCTRRSIEHPTLYTLTVQLIRPGSAGLPDRVLDEKTIRFGFRTVQFVAGGLYLNGQARGAAGPEPPPELRLSGRMPCRTASSGWMLRS